MDGTMRENAQKIKKTWRRRQRTDETQLTHTRMNTERHTHSPTLNESIRICTNKRINYFNDVSLVVKYVSCCQIIPINFSLFICLFACVISRSLFSLSISVYVSFPFHSCPSPHQSTRDYADDVFSLPFLMESRKQSSYFTSTGNNYAHILCNWFMFRR